MTKKKTRSNSKTTRKSVRVERSYPRDTIERAIRIPRALKDKNNGNEMNSELVADAVDISPKSASFFYLSAASRDYGFSEGTRDTQKIALKDLGKALVFAASQEDEKAALMQAFLGIDVFKKVLEYYGGNQLPEKKYLSNVLQNEFKLSPEIHEEFIHLFTANCKFLGIGAKFSDAKAKRTISESNNGDDNTSVVTLAKPSTNTDLMCFVIMPFIEREERHESGFFEEVLDSLLLPAATKAGFEVRSASRHGSDVIQSTIINDLLEADLVLVDLTEHNPNVMFELGIRMAVDKPIALIRASGTGKIFDVDNMLRVYDYNPNLWPSTVKYDLPKMQDHIQASWDNRNSDFTYMKLLRKSVSGSKVDSSYEVKPGIEKPSEVLNVGIVAH